MANVIHKIHLKLEEFQRIKCTRRAKPLHVGIQNGLLTLWYETRLGNHPDEMIICIVGTGHDIPESVKAHIGSVQMSLPSGDFVWHIYEASHDHNSMMRAPFLRADHAPGCPARNNPPEPCTCEIYRP